MKVFTCASVAFAFFCFSGAVRADIPKPILNSDIVDAAPAQVWEAFTTKAGQESWQVAHADIDLRVGGLLRTHYAKEGKIGDENTIQSLILSFDPERMLSLRIVHPPRKFPFKTAAKSVWTLIYFEPVDAEHTRVTVKMLGWTDTEEARKMRTFFASGNRWVLDKLKAHFAQRKEEQR